jgi:hypothetical protein
MADYDDTLRAAGATVLVWRRFGSYQGDWLAKVEYQTEIEAKVTENIEWDLDAKDMLDYVKENAIGKK